MDEAPLLWDVWRRRRGEILDAIHAAGGFGTFLDAQGRLHVMSRPNGDPQVLAAVADAVAAVVGHRVPTIARDPDELDQLMDLGRLFDAPHRVLPIAAEIERLLVRWHGDEKAGSRHHDRQLTCQLLRADLDVDELIVLADRLAAWVGDATELDEATADAVLMMRAAWSLAACLRAARHLQDTYQHATSQLVFALYVHDWALLDALLDADALPGNEWDFGLRDDDGLWRMGGDPEAVPWTDPAEVAMFLDDRFSEALRALDADQGPGDA